MRFLGRATLPFGIVYLGYYVANGRFGAFETVYALLAATTAIFLIIQGRSFRRDPRFQ